MKPIHALSLEELQLIFFGRKPFMRTTPFVSTGPSKWRIMKFYFRAGSHSLVPVKSTGQSGSGGKKGSRKLPAKPRSSNCHGGIEQGRPQSSTSTRSIMSRSSTQRSTSSEIQEPGDSPTHQWDSNYALVHTSTAQNRSPRFDTPPSSSSHGLLESQFQHAYTHHPPTTNMQQTYSDFNTVAVYANSGLELLAPESVQGQMMVPRQVQNHSQFIPDHPLAVLGHPMGFASLHSPSGYEAQDSVYGPQKNLITGVPSNVQYGRMVDDHTYPLYSSNPPTYQY